ncbi:hypothetical protein BJ322DRAFT_776940 [Thelephora terrestris]|uniref:Uncharacterized protein n=1 Tax=Thelephora terrestris TaxID=56493 RepID=A0A9P6HFP6_9AGAM|nr:hypothetical protein BJ322DRAFT_776940 [Thelephora terrestris]
MASIVLMESTSEYLRIFTRLVPWTRAEWPSSPSCSQSPTWNRAPGNLKFTPFDREIEDERYHVALENTARSACGIMYSVVRRSKGSPLVVRFPAKGATLTIATPAKLPWHKLRGDLFLNVLEGGRKPGTTGSEPRISVPPVRKVAGRDPTPSSESAFSIPRSVLNPPSTEERLPNPCRDLSKPTAQIPLHQSSGWFWKPP